MDFALSDGQRLLVAAARDFLGRHCPLDAPVRSEGAPVADDLWPQMAELGWPGLLVPGRLGGSDGTLLDVMLLVHEMGYAGLDSPYVESAVVATSVLLAAGREALVTELAAGRRRAALAVLEERGELAADGVTLAPAGGKLSGRKLFVAHAESADDLLVAERGPRGIDLLCLPRTRPGIDVVPMSSMAGDPLDAVEFDAVAVADTDRVGAEGAGWDLLGPALRLGALARSAEMVGAARRILELAVEHAKTRVQSGRPIGAFQAIQHACADLARGVESAWPLVLAAAWRAQTGLSCEAEAAMAKSYAGEACVAVARRAHQIFGAIGYCDEHALHRFHKRILAARLAYGDTAHHAETIAAALGLA